jgi:formylglycine-generating enzyme required for sulfatase activity
MKKWSKMLLFIVFIALGFTVQAQTKPSLTILPFTGEIGGDEETITILLANHEEFRNAFTVLPSTSNFKTLVADIESNSSLSTKDDIIAAVHAKLNAEFAVIVRTEKAGNNKVGLISIINTANLQQLGGKYIKYNTVREVRNSLGDIVGNMINAVKPNTAEVLPRLSVLPFYTPIEGPEVLDAEILVELLIGELANSGKYVVLPWALAIETLLTDLEVPYYGILEPVSINAFGQAANIQYVLTGDLLNLGTTNLFMASVVSTADVHVLTSGEIEYRIILEDLRLVSELSAVVMYGKDAIIEPAPENPPVFVAVAPPVEEPLFLDPLPDDPIVPNPLESFVKIAAGTYIMGTPNSERSRDSDEIQHRVGVGSFYIGKYEVTQKEYEAVMGTNPSYFKGPTLPVDQISWFDAITYCNARSVKEGLRPVYTIQGDTVIWDQKANGYRLPTETEWEYACRAGTTTAFNTGDVLTTDQSNYDGTYSYNKSPVGTYRQTTTPVGTFSPNAWDLYDMHGNVYEWCWDWYEDYNTNNRSVYLSTDRVIRGGSWFSAPRYLRSGNRVHINPIVHAYYVGFRLARNISE